MKKWFIFYGILFSLLFFSMTETYAEEPEKTEESEIVWLAIDDKENFSESQRREAVSPSDEQLIVEGIKNLQTYIPVTDGNLDLDGTRWIYHRHPEIWAYVHGIGLKMVNGVTVSVIVNYHEDALERKTQIEAAMQEALDAVDTEGMSQVDIVLAYYQYLSELTEYDHAYDKDPHAYDGTNYYEDKNGSAYGALVEHSCVCTGYANAFYLLMWMQGIPCELVDGYNHEWNAVYLNGQWYHLDATWDDVDSYSRMNYSYFLISEDKLAKDSTHKKFKVYQYGDVPYTEATDDSFEKMFLGKIRGFLHFYNGDWYYLGNGDKFYYNISRINLNSMQSTQIFSEKCIWHNGTDSLTYSSQYGCGTGYKNMFYYSKPTTIEAYNLDTGEHGTVFAPELSNEYIFAFGEHDGRPAYQTGVDSWNMGEIKYIDSFVISDKQQKMNNIKAFVSRLYLLILNREADIDGLNSWSQQLIDRTATGAQIVQGFVESEEFVGRGLSNEEVVEIMYQAMLGRASDEDGKNAWTTILDNGCSYLYIVNGFSGSAEFGEICGNYGITAGTVELGRYCDRNPQITGFVARCYTKALGREYEPEGLEAWCKVIIEKSNTPKQVAQNFIFSDEFVQKDLSDEEYVKVLYRTFMGREADEGGLTAWVAVLESGKEDRAKVLEGFSDSVEFDGILQSFGLK